MRGECIDTTGNINVENRNRQVGLVMETLSGRFGRQSPGFSAIAVVATGIGVVIGVGVQLPGVSATGRRTAIEGRLLANFLSIINRVEMATCVPDTYRPDRAAVGN